MLRGAFVVVFLAAAAFIGLALSDWLLDRPGFRLDGPSVTRRR